MSREILPGLRTTFLIHVIVAAIVGLGYLLVPELFLGIFGVPVADTFPWRTLGAATLAFGASSYWAWRETEWAAVKIIVETELVWTVLGTIVGVWGMLTLGYGPLAWVEPILLAAFAIAFGYFYQREMAVNPHPIAH